MREQAFRIACKLSDISKRGDAIAALVRELGENLARRGKSIRFSLRWRADDPPLIPEAQRQTRGDRE